MNLEKENTAEMPSEEQIQKPKENEQMADQLLFLAHNLFEYDWSIEQRGQLCNIIYSRQFQFRKLHVFIHFTRKIHFYYY